MTAKRFSALMAVMFLAGFAGKVFAQGSVTLNGTTQYITMGGGAGSSVNTALDSSVFTLECWFNWGGGGTVASTGGAGIATMIPLIAKGAAEAEGSNVDANYVFGISGGKLAADFEQIGVASGTTQNAPGLNRPICGSVTVTSGVWHHAAAVYDGACWHLYLDGVEDTGLNSTCVTGAIDWEACPKHSATAGGTDNGVNAVPRSDSIQHFGIGTTLNSTGTAAGFFQGSIDEVRVWNVARTSSEISTNKNLPLITGTGLTGRWGLNERGGIEAFDSAGATRQTGALAPTPASPATFFTATGAPLLFSAGGEVTVSFQQGTGGYTSAVDTTLTELTPTTAQNTSLVVASDLSNPPTASDGRHGLIRFNNIQGAGSGLIPAGAAIHSATMTVTVSNVTVAPPSNFHRMLVDWAPTATWNSMVAGIQTGTEAATTPDATPGNLLVAGRHNIDLTAGVVAWQGGAPNYGWAWLPATTDGVEVTSAEGATVADRPNLVVSYLTNPNLSPNAPTVVTPLNGAHGVSTSPTLTVNVTDPESNPMTVTFFGRETNAESADFTIIALPDTQFYSCDNGTACPAVSPNGPAIWNAQTQWIVNNRASRNIVFVAHLGDCVEHGDAGNGSNPDPDYEWDVADPALSLLENPGTTGLPFGIPYGVAVGNHDQTPIGTARNGADEGATTVRYNNHFGLSRWTGRPYYGGRYDFGAPGTYPNNNDNHYQLFSAGGMDFIAISLEWDDTANATRTAALSWANGLLATYSNRRAIVYAHFLVDASGAWSNQGLATYTALQGNSNLFLMLNGHDPGGEARRSDPVAGGNTVNSLLADYQGRANGGDGWLRILTFSPANNTIHVQTFSPTRNGGLGEFETDANSDFVLTYNMVPSFAQIGSPQTGVASGGNASVVWPGLTSDAFHEWYVTVSDGTNTITGPTWSFTTTCSSDAACDDGNPCTDDTCNFGTGTCQNVNDNTNSCTDGTACTVGDACVAGVCVPGTLTTCPGTQVCNSTSGECEFPPVTVTFQQGTNGYTGAVDTFLQSDAPTTSNATNVALTVDLSPIKHILMRFGNVFGSGAGQIPTGSTISSASLTINVTNESANAGACLHRMLQPWNDTDTYDSRVTGIQANGVEAATVADKCSLSAVALHTINFTTSDELASLTAWLANPSSNYGWAWLPPALTDNSWVFDSAEGATVTLRPKLSITYVPPPPCTQNSQCNDGNPCTDDSCNLGTGLCQYVNDNTNTCTDGNGCTVGDACVAGVCVPGTPATCPGTQICVAPGGACMLPVTVTFQQGTNGYTGAADTFLQSDFPALSNATFNALTVDAVPVKQILMRFGNIFGSSVGQIPSGTSISSASLTINVTNESANAGACLHRMLQPWNDTDTYDTWVTGIQTNGVEAATTADKCSVSGVALHTITFTTPGELASLTAWLANPSSNYGWAWIPPATDNGWVFDSAEGATVSLRPKLSVTYLIPPCTQDSQCSDSNACNGVEICNTGTGACGAGTPLNCDDSNVCTDDSCIPASGCQHVNNTVSCNDGNDCTSDDSCFSGSCAGIPIPGCCTSDAQCDDGFDCTTDTCPSGNLGGLNFDGINDMVTTAGSAPGLGAAAFTLEAWIRRDGASWGDGTNGLTGTGGLSNVVAIIAKGRSEADATTQDCNYFFGIDPTNGRLVADFEQLTAGPGGWLAGLNHPMCSSATIGDQNWHHVAVTYDKAVGKGWRFYLDGTEVTAANGSTATCGAVSTCSDLTACVQNPGVDPRSDSIQRFALGASLDSTVGGNPGGFFGGIMDEARVWSVARTQAQIQSGKTIEIVTAPNLVGRWGMNHSSGTVATDSTTPAENGTLTNFPASPWITDPAQLPSFRTCQNTPVTAGTPCGSSSDTVCDNPDTCNGSGVCQTNHESNGTVCTSDGIECTTDVCNAGTCTHPNASSGTACGSSSDTQCDNPDTCDGAGSCLVHHEPDGTSCTDGLFCNGTDTCLGGGCSSHTGDPCSGGTECANACNEAADNCFDPAGTLCTDDGNECTDNECDGAGVCAAIPNGDACDDDDPCTDNDVCAGGSCQGTVIPSCVECVTSANCDDGNDCTNDSCVSNTCSHTPTLAGTLCTEDGNPCTDNECNGAGLCVALNNNDPCDDGLFCNGLDTCSGGSCSMHVGNPCAGGTECGDSCNEAANNCFDPAGTSCTDDGNICTDNQCNGAGLCVAINNSHSCTDGLFCNGLDTCSGGSCTVHAGNPCTGGSECADACNEAADNCFDPAGTTCTDDGNICTDNQCNGSGACVATNNSHSCNDGLFCNGADTCSGGSCTVHAGNPCTGGSECADACNETADNCFDPAGTTCTDDGNICTDNQCNGSGSCVATNNSHSCNDGLFCNGADTCSGGSCTVHAGNPCTGGSECADACNETADNCFDPIGTACTDDGNVCTNNECNGAGLCVAINNSHSCTDGLFCNGLDTCSGGSCTVHAGNPCTGGSECADACNETADNCFDPAGTSCTDDGNICTDNQCNGSGSCVATNNSHSCNDGLFCNGADTCSGGSCTVHAGNPCTGGTECADACNEAADNCFDPAGTLCTDDGNVCTDNRCNGSGLCVAQNNSVTCSDNNSCTTNDVCTGGVCVGGAAPNCNDSNVCTTDSCNPGSGCVHAPVSNGTLCDDGLFCNGTNTCQGGTCVVGQPNCSNACETCDENTNSCEWCILDVDQNGGMGTGDFSFFAGCFGACYPPQHTCALANFDGDPNNCAGTGDFAGFAGCFGLSCAQCANCHGSLLRGQDTVASVSKPLDIHLVVTHEPADLDLSDALPASETTVNLHSPFAVEVWVHQGALASSELGLSAAYADIQFNSAMIQIEGVENSGTFPLFPKAELDATRGLVQSVGGCASLNGSTHYGAEWVRLAILQARATRLGTTVFNLSASEQPLGVSVLSKFGDLEQNELRYVGASLQIQAQEPDDKPTRGSRNSVR